MVQLLDQYGRPVSTASLKREQAAPTTMGVRRPNIEHQASGLTPGKLGRMLRTSMNGDPQAYLELAEDMEERDLHYAGVLGSRKLQVAGLDVTVEAASDKAEDEANADMIRAFVKRDAFETELIDILDATGKGFSGTEIIWDTSASQWEPVALKWRDPRWFRFSEIDGETPLLRETSGDVPLAPFKWVFHCAKVKSGLPIRGGIARAVCWTFLFKSFTQKDWAIFAEAYGQPLRLGKYGPGASETDKEVLMQAVANIGVDYSAIVPASMAVEFVKADISGSHELYEKRADWLDRQVSKLVLGQTGTTDMSGSSGYAQAKVHDGVKSDIECSDAKQLAASLNRDLVRPYIDLNRGPQKAYPTIRIGRPEAVDLDKWMGNVKTFVSMGGKVGMSVVRDKLGIEDPGDDEELLGQRSEPPKDDQGKQPPALPKRVEPPIGVAVHRPQMRSDFKDDIDLSIEDMLAEDGFVPAVDQIIEGLDAKLAAVSTVEEARQMLADHLRQLDVEALASKLAQAAFAARLAGMGNEPLSDGI